jgi:hypothetical protein
VTTFYTYPQLTPNDAIAADRKVWVHLGRFAGRLIRLVRWRGRARKMLESYAPIGRMNLWITVWGERCPPP